MPKKDITKPKLARRYRLQIKKLTDDLKREQKRKVYWRKQAKRAQAAHSPVTHGSRYIGFVKYR